MKLTLNNHVTKTPLPITLTPAMKEIFDTLTAKGMKPLIVGGAVRDAVMGKVPTDFDVEVYFTDYPRLTEALDPFGALNVVGKGFGVIKLRTPDGQDYDFSIPRRENRIGVGHRDFNVEFDPTITPKDAAARRDFTINSLSYDPLTTELYDYFGGRDDIERKVLRHVGMAFAEDVLRVLRGMQFVARFGLTVHPSTLQVMREQMSRGTHFRALAKERIAEEWMKAMTKGQYPGWCLQFLQDTDWLKFFPQIEDIFDVPQDPEWHPESEVQYHTAYVMDAAADIADREGLTGDDRAVLLFAALCHDFGKAHTTCLREKGGRERWTAHGHEEAGGPLADDFLRSIGVKRSIIKRVRPLVEHHLAHIRLIQGPYQSKTSRVLQLAAKLAPATTRELLWLMEADASGRPPLPQGLPMEAVTLSDLATLHGCLDGPQAPIIQGRDVLAYFGGKPNVLIGPVVRAAYDAQLKSQFRTSAEGQAWLDSYLRRRIALIKGDDVLFRLKLVEGPEVGKMLDKAWKAQRMGVFVTRPEALAWLERQPNTTMDTRDLKAGSEKSRAQCLETTGQVDEHYPEVDTE